MIASVPGHCLFFTFYPANKVSNAYTRTNKQEFIAPCSVNNNNCLFVCVEVSGPSQNFFSHVGTEPPLPVYHLYFSVRKCVFAQDHNTAEVGIEPRHAAPESETLPLGHRAPPQIPA